jgi:hypothetical protein
MAIVSGMLNLALGLPTRATNTAVMREKEAKNGFYCVASSGIVRIGNFRQPFAWSLLQDSIMVNRHPYLYISHDLVLHECSDRGMGRSDDDYWRICNHVRSSLGWNLLQSSEIRQAVCTIGKTASGTARDVWTAQLVVSVLSHRLDDAKIDDESKQPGSLADLTIICFRARSRHL